MRVMCISKSPNKCWNTGRVVSIPIVGESYTVTNVTSDHKSTYYELEELTPRIGYEAFRFIPLSEIDETTFERNFKKELV